MAKLLVFRLFGDYGHFKKFYTTTSPLTFEFPPPATMLGIISAIIGLDKEEYLKFFQEAEKFRLAIKLNSPVKKVRWSQNLIDTKKHFWLIENRTQIRFEFLKNPDFTVYFSHENPEILEKLKQNLAGHRSVYSIALGLSELLANFEFIRETTILEKKKDDFLEVSSVVPASFLQDESSIKFENEREIFKTNFPIWMNENRIVTKREDILFERTAKPLSCKLKKYWQTEGGENLVFF